MPPHFFRALKTHRDFFIGMAAGVPALLLYLSCLSPTLTYGGDSGELIAASQRFGIAHPTGYPLYMLLGKTFALLLPVGEIAWRYSFLSAIFGALAVAIIAITIFDILSPRVLAGAENGATFSANERGAAVCSIGAALLLAGFHAFWTQAIIAEVYSLNALMLSLLFFASVRWQQSADWRWFYALGALCGLAFNAHLSFVFLVPGLFLFAVIAQKQRFQNNASKFFIALFFCALAFALTLYLPLRARLFPTPMGDAWWPLDWTHPATFANWRAHISGAQYKHLLMAPHAFLLGGKVFHAPFFVEPLSTLPARLGELFLKIAVGYLWLCPLLVIGAVRSFRRDKSGDASTRGAYFGAMLLLTVVFNVGLEINYQVSDRENFFFPAYLAMAIWMGLGLDAMRQKIAPLLDGASTRAPQNGAMPHSAMLRRLVARFAILILPLTVALQWFILWPQVSLRGDTAAGDTAVTRAQIAEQFSRAAAPTILLGGDDATWGFWYAQYALHRAPRAVTPWGKAVRDTMDSPRSVPYVAALQRRGPVLISFWNDAIDARFPLVLLSRGGELCLASRRVLPLPAAPLFTKVPSKFGDSWLLDARFRPRVLAQNGKPQLAFKRENLAVLKTDFALPNGTPISPNIANAPTRGDGAMQVAWLEVFIASPKFPAPAPLQSDVRASRAKDANFLAWKQRRRLIVPQNARASTRWRAALPIQMKTEALTGRYAVWLRIVTTPRDAKTPWHRLGEIKMSDD